MLDLLENGMCQYKEALLELNGLDVDKIKGAGAAGGLGAAFVSVLNANLKAGIEAILDLVNFDELIKDAELVITGEGMIDEQTIYGKVPTGVSRRCIGKKPQVIALVGAEGLNSKKVYDYGIDAIISTVTGPVNQDKLEKDAALRLEEAVDKLCRLIKIGISIGG